MIESEDEVEYVHKRSKVQECENPVIAVIDSNPNPNPGVENEEPVNNTPITRTQEELEAVMGIGKGSSYLSEDGGEEKRKILLLAIAKKYASNGSLQQATPEQIPNLPRNDNAGFIDGTKWESMTHKKTGLLIQYHRDLGVATLIRPWDIPQGCPPEEIAVPRGIFTQAGAFVSQYQLGSENGYYFALKAYFESVKSRIDYFGENNKGTPGIEEVEEVITKEQETINAPSEDPKWLQGLTKDAASLSNYMRHAYDRKPHYKLFPLSQLNPNDETKVFVTVVEIAGKPFGVGVGESRKIAKREAATKTLKILLPDYVAAYSVADKDVDGIDKDVLQFYDQTPKESSLLLQRSKDPNVKVPTPTYILQRYVELFSPLLGTDYDSNTIGEGSSNVSWTMTLGSMYKVSGVSSTKANARTDAAQAILCKALHFLRTWGSVIRFVLNPGIAIIKKLETPKDTIKSVTLKIDSTKPNYDLLNRVKKEMLNLYCADDKRIPIDSHVPRMDVDDDADMNKETCDTNRDSSEYRAKRQPIDLPQSFVAANASTYNWPNNHEYQLQRIP